MAPRGLAMRQDSAGWGQSSQDPADPRGSGHPVPLAWTNPSDVFSWRLCAPIEYMSFLVLSRSEGCSHAVPSPSEESGWGVCR